MGDKTSPGAGPSKSPPTATFGEVIKEIARRNDEVHKAAREARTVREQEAIARRRRWERM